MIVDLRTCKPGDKLLSKHGTILEYVGPCEDNSSYDHEVKYPNGGHGTRLHNGNVYKHTRMDCDEDIVEILKEAKK